MKALLFLIPIALGLLWKANQEEVPLKSNCSGCQDSSTNLEADILYNMPFFDYSSLLVQDKKLYNKTFLLDNQMINPKNETKKALLYGAYWADVVWLYLFDKKQELPSYFNSLQALHQDLEISYSIDYDHIKKSKVSNLDSLYNHLNTNFNHITCCLASQKREYINTLILFSAWLEQMNYLCLLYEKHPSVEVKKRILFGKISIEALKMAVTVKNHQKSLPYVYITDLIHKFDKSEVRTKVRSGHFSNSLEQKKELIIEGETDNFSITVSDSDFLAIRQEIKRLRTELLVK